MAPAMVVVYLSLRCLPAMVLAMDMAPRLPIDAAQQDVAVQRAAAAAQPLHEVVE